MDFSKRFLGLLASSHLQGFASSLGPFRFSVARAPKPALLFLRALRFDFGDCPTIFRRITSLATFFLWERGPFRPCPKWLSLTLRRASRVPYPSAEEQVPRFPASCWRISLPARFPWIASFRCHHNRCLPSGKRLVSSKGSLPVSFSQSLGEDCIRSAWTSLRLPLRLFRESRVLGFAFRLGFPRFPAH